MSKFPKSKIFHKPIAQNTKPNQTQNPISNSLPLNTISMSQITNSKTTKTLTKAHYQKRKTKQNPQPQFSHTWAEISSAANCLPIAGQSNFTFPFSSLTTLYETCLLSSSTSVIFLPINLFTEKNVFSGFTTACRFAIWPTNISPFFAYATTDGVVLCPSAFVTIVGFPPSIAATAEFVVPKSIPTTFSLTTLKGPTFFALSFG